MTLRPFGLWRALLTLVLFVGPAFASQAEQPAAAPAPQRPRTPPRPSTAVQVPPAPGAPAATPAPPAPPTLVTRRVFQSVNVKVDLSITDQRSGSPPVMRTLSLVVADGGSGSVRTQSDVLAVGPVPLNVDANPELLADGKIRLSISLQYDWPAPPAPPDQPDRPRGGTIVKTALHDSLGLILENGKSMVVAQSADPIGDRQVTVEVKATVLK